MELPWNLDNYIIQVAPIIAAIAAYFTEFSSALVVLGIALILKAIFSAIDPNYKVISIDNIDNMALALAGAFTAIAAIEGHPTLSMAAVIVGAFFKAVASALVRGNELSVNIDNVILAGATAVSGALISYGYIQIAAIVTSIAIFLKGTIGNYLRKTTVLAPPVTDPTEPSTTSSGSTTPTTPT